MWKPIILDVECIACNKSLQKINHNHGPPELTRKMGKITCRRSRTPNWSADEKKYLLELIKERKDVVVTKNNNGPNYSEEKDVAWNEILRELCVKFGNKFSGSSTKKVKTQWQNMKRIAREEIALVGPDVSKFTRQTVDVCNILDMIKDGVLKRDSENLNDTLMNIEIKAERIDEDQIEPSSTIGRDSSSMEEEAGSKNASVMTESFDEDTGCTGPFHRQLWQEIFRYLPDTIQRKMETLEEERRVVKVMRETAELHKIIAEQKLKHVLRVNKQEMA